MQVDAEADADAGARVAARHARGPRRFAACEAVAEADRHCALTALITPSGRDAVAVSRAGHRHLRAGLFRSAQAVESIAQLRDGQTQRADLAVQRRDHRVCITFARVDRLGLRLIDLAHVRSVCRHRARSDVRDLSREPCRRVADAHRIRPVSHAACAERDAARADRDRSSSERGAARADRARACAEGSAVRAFCESAGAERGAACARRECGEAQCRALVARRRREHPDSGLARSCVTRAGPSDRAITERGAARSPRA